MTQAIQTLKVVNPAVNVYEAAQARIAALFERFPHVSVSFSGGKDSTVVLHLALEEARRRQRRLSVLFCDEEAVDPDTEAYVHQVATWPELDFRWLCAPVRHTLQSHARQFWTCWDPEASAVWIRPRPERGIVDDPDWFPGMSLNAAATLPEVPAGQQCVLVGIRAQESFNRMRAILTSGGYLYRQPREWYAKPIYDWKVTDVWHVIRQQGWPYSAHYDKLRRIGLARTKQRLAPMGNVASVAAASLWAALYPDFWNRVLRRLPEMQSMARYGTTRLYRKGQAKPAGLTWQEWVFLLLHDLHDPVLQAYFRNELAHWLVRWERSYSIPFPEEPIRQGGSGSMVRLPYSWKWVAKVIAKHDMIGGASRDRL